MQLQQAAEQIGQLPLDVMAVTFQSAEVAGAYVEQTGWPWPMLVDTDRALYNAYAMHRGGIWAVWGPKSWWGFLKLIFKGRRLRPPAGDVYQLGGDVLLDPFGGVKLHHVMRVPVDRPDVKSILDLVLA